MVKKNDFRVSLNAGGYLNCSDKSARNPYKRSRYSESLGDYESDSIVELNQLSAEQKKKIVHTVYRQSGFSYRSGDANASLRASLAGQDHVCNRFVMRVNPCTAVGVWYKTKRGWDMLWKVGMLSDHKKPVYLNLELLKKALSRALEVIDIKLGQLSMGAFKCIAWEVVSKQGVFYIPWHNGAMIEKEDELKFFEMEFQEVKRTYNILKFSKDYDSVGHGVCYRVE